MAKKNFLAFLRLDDEVKKHIEGGRGYKLGRSKPTYDDYEDKANRKVVGYVFDFVVESDDEDIDGLTLDLLIPRDVLDLAQYGEEGVRKRVIIDDIGELRSFNYGVPRFEVAKAHFANESGKGNAGLV